MSNVENNFLNTKYFFDFLRADTLARYIIKCKQKIEKILAFMKSNI